MADARTLTEINIYWLQNYKQNKSLILPSSLNLANTIAH